MGNGVTLEKLRNLSIPVSVILAANLAYFKAGSIQAQEENPRLYVLANPPSSQVGLVLRGKYYWFHRIPPDEPCDFRFDGACYMKSDTKIAQVSKDIISINGGKAFGCSPAIIPDTSKKRGPGYFPLELIAANCSAQPAGPPFF